jgi:hypothetical protein
MSQPRPAPLAALKENSEPKTSVPIMAMSGKKGERRHNSPEGKISLPKEKRGEVSWPV